MKGETEHDLQELPFLLTIELFRLFLTIFTISTSKRIEGD